jgi:hypothetical protein
MPVRGISTADILALEERKERDQQRDNDQEKLRIAPTPVVNRPDTVEAQPKAKGISTADIMAMEEGRQEGQDDFQTTGERMLQDVKDLPGNIAKSPRVAKDLFTNAMTTMVGGTMKGISGAAHMAERRVLPERAAEEMKRSRLDFDKFADRLLNTATPSHVREQREKGEGGVESLAHHVAGIGGQLLKYGAVFSATGGAGVMALAGTEGAGTGKMESLSRLQEKVKAGELTEEEAETISDGVGAIGGVAEAAFQYLPAKFVGGKFGAKLTDRITKYTVGRLAAGTANFTSEGFEEMGVGAASDAAQYFLEHKEDAFQDFAKRRLQEFAAGVAGMGMARGVQVSSQKMTQLVDKMSAVASTPAGRAKLERLSEIAEPSRKDLKDAGLQIKGNLNAEDRKLVAKGAAVLGEFDTIEHSVRKLAGRSADPTRMSDMDKSAAIDLAENGNAEGLQSLGIAREDAELLLREKWLAEDKANQKARIGGKPELTTPKMNKVRTNQLNTLAESYKQTPDTDTEVDEFIRGETVQEEIPGELGQLINRGRLDVANVSREAKVNATQKEVQKLQGRRTHYREMAEMARGKGDTDAADAYDRIAREAGTTIKNRLALLQKSETEQRPADQPDTPAPVETQEVSPGETQQEQRVADEPQNVQVEPAVGDPRAPKKPITPEAVREEGGFASLRDVSLDKLKEKGAYVMGVARKIKKGLDYEFGSNQGRDPEIARAMRNSKGRLAKIDQQIRQHLGDFQRAMKKAAKVDGKYGTPDQIADQADQYLKGETSIDSLPKEIRVEAKAMREYIDDFSREALNSGAVTGGKFMGSVKARTALFDSLRTQVKAGSMDRKSLIMVLKGRGLNKGLAETAASILHNDGIYLTRTFEAFEPGTRWGKDMPDDIRKDMHKMLRDENTARIGLVRMRNNKRVEQGKPAHKVPEELTDNQIEQRMEEILTAAAESGDLGSYIKGRKLGKQNRDILKRRKNLSKTYREFLGEIRDPSENFLRSIKKVAHLIDNYRTAVELRDLGADKFMWQHSDKERPPEASARIAQKDDMSREPLQDMFTTPEMKAMMEVQSNWWSKDGMGAVVGRYYGIESALQMMKTIGSVQAHARQLVGNPMMLLANGKYPTIAGMTNAWKSWKVGVFNKGNAAAREKWNEYTELNLTQSSPEMELFRRWANKQKTVERVMEETIKKGNAIVKKGKAAAELAKEQYSFEDTAFKIMAYEAELADYRKTGAFDTSTPEGEMALKRHVADIVHHTQPSADTMPKIVEHVRNVPLFGMFMGFPTSQAVNAVYRAKQTAKEIFNKNEDPEVRAKIRAIGYKRALGQLVMYSAGGLMAEMMRELAGVSKEQMAALRKVLPSYSANATLWPLGTDGDEISYINMSYIDPSSYFITPLLTLLRGGSEGEFLDGLKDAAAQVVEPYMGETMAGSLLFDLARNQTEWGSDVYTEEAPPEHIALDIIGHAAKKLGPGTALSVDKVAKGALGRVSKGGKVFDLSDELMAMFTGVKMEKFNTRTGFSFAMNDFSKGLMASEKAMRPLQTEGTISGMSARVNIDKAQRTRENVIANMHKQYESFRQLNPDINQSYFRQELPSRVTDSEFEQAYTGVAEKFVPPYLVTMDRIIEHTNDPEYKRLAEETRQTKLMETAWSLGSPPNDKNGGDITRWREDLGRYNMSGEEAMSRMQYHQQMKDVDSAFEKITKDTGGKFPPDQVRKVAMAKIFGKPFKWTKARKARAARVGQAMGLSGEEILDFIEGNRVR